MNYKIVKSEVIFKGKVFNRIVNQIEYHSGNKAVREVAEHPGGAVVVPLTDDGKIVMVTQHRYPMNEILLELPAGKLGKSEDPRLCAVRELEEETGMNDLFMEQLYTFGAPDRDPRGRVISVAYYALVSLAHHADQIIADLWNLLVDSFEDYPIDRENHHHDPISHPGGQQLLRWLCYDQ